MPITVKLLLNQLYYSLLLRFYPCLFLPEPIQLCLSLSDLFPMRVEVIKPSVWILIPNIKKSNDYISSKVVKSIDVVGRQLSFVVLILLIIKVMRRELKDITILRLFFGLHHSIVTLLIEGFLDIIIDLLALLVQTIPNQVSSACVLFWLKLVIESVHVISAFQCIRMHDAKLLIKHNSSTSLFGLIFVTILCLHVFAGKDALLELEVNAIFTQHLREDLTLHLLYELIDSVSEGKISLEGGMSMQIEVHEKSLVYGKVFAQLFYGKARRLLLDIRICIISIEVLVENVHSAMSSCDSIWIEHRNKHKNKVLPQQMSPHIFLIQQKLNDAVHAVTRRRFYGMHSCRDKDNRLIASEFNDFFIFERPAFDSFIPLLSFMRRDDNTIYYPSLIGLCQFILLKEQLLIVLILLLHLNNILPAVFISIGINECELDTPNIFRKEIIELQRNSLIGNTEIKNRMWQSKPFCCLLMVIVDSVNRSIQLIFLDYRVQKMYPMDRKCDSSIDKASSFEIEPTFGVALIISTLCIACSPDGVMLVCKFSDPVHVA